MTRGNINFVYQRLGHSPETLYLYYNGDQYPRGLRDYFNVIDFAKSDFTPTAFKKWIANNYTETQSVTYSNPATGASITSNYVPTEIPAKPRKISKPCIYYDDAGFVTDYSYIFDACGTDKKIMVYEWSDKVFDGTPDEFITWIKKQK